MKRTLLLAVLVILALSPAHAAVPLPMLLSACTLGGPTGAHNNAGVWSGVQSGSSWACNVVLPVAGAYTVTMTVGRWGAGSLHFEDPKGTTVGKLLVPDTGAFTATFAATATALLPAGTSTLTVIADNCCTAIKDTFSLTPPTAVVGAAPTVGITPAGAALPVAPSQQFTATALNDTAGTGVDWTTSAGTITPAGLYIPPPTVPSGGVATVTATLRSNHAVTATAIVTVGGIAPPPPAVAVSVMPTSVTVQVGVLVQFQASVLNTTVHSVTWTASCGTVTAAGQFTTPATVPTSPCAVLATSVADPTKSAAAAVTVTAASPIQHVVTVTWIPSTSNVAGYNMYRAKAAGGPYVRLNAALLTGSTSYGDATVVSGTTYYYVSTAVDTNGNESANSNEAQIVIPKP